MLGSRFRLDGAPRSPSLGVEVPRGGARSRASCTGSLSHVRQEDRLGCGLAGVAMIAGVSYADAKPAVKSRPNRSGNTTTYADLRWGLDSFGIVYEWHGRRAFPFKGWAALPDRAIAGGAPNATPQGTKGEGP